MRRVHVDEQNDQETKHDHDDDPKEGHRRVAAHPLKVDGDGDGLGNAGVVARKEQGAAKLAHRAGKGKHRAGGDGGPAERHHELGKDATLGPSQGSRGIEHLRVKALKGTERRTVDQGKRHHHGRYHRRGPRKDNRDAMRDEPLAHPGRAAKQHEEQKAADRGRQHHRNRKDRIEQALDATRGTHSLPRGKQAQCKGDHQGKAARFDGHPKRAIVDVAQKGSQRGQGPPLIPQHDRRCFYHLSAIKPTRAALGITRGRCNHHIAVPIRTTHIKAIGIPAGIKRCFRRNIPRKINVP